MKLRCILRYHVTEAKPNQIGSFDIVCSNCGKKFEFPRLHDSIKINAPKEKLFSESIDYTHWKDRNPRIESVKLISESGNERHFATVWKRKKGKHIEVRKLRLELLSP